MTVLSWINHAAQAGLTASAENSLLPAQNVQTMPLGKVWRANAGSAYLDFDFGTNVALQHFTARNVRITASGTWRLQVSAVSAGADELLDTGTIASGVQDGYPHLYYDHTSELSARFLRITITNALPYTQVGYVHAGPGWQPVRNFSYGARLRWEDEADRERSLGGQPLVNSRGRWRVLGFSLDNNTPATMLANALELQRVAGLAGNVLVRLDPDNYPQEWSAYGLLQQVTPLNWAGPARMPQAFEIEDRT